MSEAQQQVIEAYFDGINHDRFDDVGALFADDAQLIAPGLKPRTGPSEIAPYFAMALKPYPEHYDDPFRIVHAEGTTTVEIHFTGKLANGEPMEFDAVDVFDFGPDGKLARLLTVYDSHLVRSRLAAARGADHRKVMLTQIDCVEGEEDAFNTWFARHVEEVLQVPGVKDVQRYRAESGTPLRRWVAVYHVAGDTDALLAELKRRRADGEWEPRVSLDEASISMGMYAPVKRDGSQPDV